MSSLLNVDGVRVGPQLYEVQNQVFSWIHFIQNGEKNIFVMLGLNPDYGFSPLIGIGGVIGAYLFARSWSISGIKQKNMISPLIFGLISVLALLPA